MMNLNPQLIEQAKAAKSAEELLALAKENNIEMTEEEANAYYAQFHAPSGELDDDELDNVSGGGCRSEKSGRVIVTSGCKCFTGQYEQFRIHHGNSSSLRGQWYSWSSDGACGRCTHLEFEGGIGVCGKT